jgi:hypothetical protein
MRRGVVVRSVVTNLVGFHGVADVKNGKVRPQKRVTSVGPVDSCPTSASREAAQPTLCTPPRHGIFSPERAAPSQSHRRLPVRQSTLEGEAPVAGNRRAPACRPKHVGPGRFAFPAPAVLGGTTSARTPLAPAEEAAILAALPRFPARDRLLLLMGLRTGLRISELLSLAVGQAWRDGGPRAELVVPRRCVKFGRGVRCRSRRSRVVVLGDSVRSARSGRRRPSPAQSWCTNPVLPL